MSQPKRYLYSVTQPIRRQGGKLLDRKLYCYVDSMGGIQLKPSASDVPVYKEDSPEFKVLEDYRNSYNFMGIKRRLSKRRGVRSLAEGNKALNQAKGCVAMIARQLERLDWLRRTVEQELGVTLDCGYELGTIGFHLYGIKQAIEQAQEEAGIRVRPKSEED